MRLFLLLTLAVSACGVRPSDAPADPGTVAGVIVSLDFSAMEVDGPARIAVRADDGREATVMVPARENLCEAHGLDVLFDLEVGDRIEVVGTAGSEGDVTPCTEAAHRLAVVEYARPRVRGVYESGFERSAFRPCDRPDEVWWLVPDEAFADRFAAIRQQEAPDGGRGLRLFVEATVIGDLAEGSEFGHLGDYEHQLTVTETRDMVYLGRDLDTPPACR